MPRWQAAASLQLGYPGGYVQVGENQYPGNRLTFHHDLGVDVLEILNLDVGYHLTPRDSFHAELQMFFLDGSTTLPTDVFFNGAKLQAGTTLNTATNFPDFFRATATYERQLLTIRDRATLGYLPEPDIFHDIAGHVPMHTDPAFARALVRFGDCAAAAVRAAAEIAYEPTRLRRLTSNIRALSRFFWFSVEFGLMRSRDALKVYGSGLLSSYGEIAHAIDAPEVQRVPFQLEWVVNQSFEIDRFQPLLFVVQSFEHLYALVGELESWIAEGRLDNVALGEPEVREQDLRSFVQAAGRQT